MAYVLTAAIGSTSTLPWPFVSMPSGYVRMWPLTSDRIRSLRDPADDKLIDGFTHLTTSMLEHLRAAAVQPLAYVEIELWAGEGTKAAMVVHQGTDLLGPIVTETGDRAAAPPIRENAVNRALRAIGVVVDDELDEFDTIGLGRYRFTEEWLAGDRLESWRLERLMEHLEGRNVGIDDGLSELELDEIEQRWSFTFPPDLRALLHRCVPAGLHFVNWRDPDDVQARFDWPAEGIEFDVRNNALWLSEWGPRPADDDEAVAEARRALADAPTLIPLAGHRYLVGDPPIAGQPVLSVYQSDIVFYGDNLTDWSHRDHGFGNPSPSDGPNRPLGLWEQFL